MPDFVQQRHQPFTPLSAPRDLVVACPPMRSNVNLDRIARAAGCCGVTRMIICGNARIDPKVARAAAESIAFEKRRTLSPALAHYRTSGYQLVGLEQSTNSTCLFDFSFQRKTVLVIGNERKGVPQEVMAMLDAVVEIPTYGLPYSHNVATAAAMCLYEYCRQFPTG